MSNPSIDQLREELRQAELWASVAVALAAIAENDKLVAMDRLAAARLELQMAEESKRGET